MKKALMAGLTGALLLGVTGTSFAASNPFTDVPRGHWAYDAVEQLRQDGVIEGYGDGTYRGERTITRYEMAQMIARAMDQFDQQVKGLSGQKPVVQNVGADKAMLDRLAAEFADELNSLGVRVSNLEKYADKITWHGKIEYTYHSKRVEDLSKTKNKVNSNGYVFRLEPVAEVNDHWTARARIDVNGDFKDDSMNDAAGKRVWAQADYDKFQLKAGKFEFYTNETGLVWDTELSGGQLTFGSKVKFSAMGGRLSKGTVVGLNNNIVNTGYKTHRHWSNPWFDNEYRDANGDIQYVTGNNANDYSNVWGVNVQVDPGDKGLYGGVGYYQVKDDDFKNSYYFDKDLVVRPGYTDSLTKVEDEAKIWSANLGYKFGNKAKLWGSYANNTEADIEDYSWQAELDYGNYAAASEKGQWSLWAGYRRFGANTTLAGTAEDDIYLGSKGWFVGGAWAPFKNIGVVLKYGNGEMITSGNDLEKLFGRVELFF